LQQNILVTVLMLLIIADFIFPAVSTLTCRFSIPSSGIIDYSRRYVYGQWTGFGRLRNATYHDALLTSPIDFVVIVGWMGHKGEWQYENWSRPNVAEPLIDALHQKGMRVFIYFSPFEADVDWVQANPDFFQYTLKDDAGNPRISGDWYVMDLTTQYGDYLLSRTKSIFEEWYPTADGLFLDLFYRPQPWFFPSFNWMENCSALLKKYSKESIIQWSWQVPLDQAPFNSTVNYADCLNFDFSQNPMGLEAQITAKSTHIESMFPNVPLALNFAIHRTDPNPLWTQDDLIWALEMCNETNSGLAIDDNADVILNSSLVSILQAYKPVLAS
jgi:hypothetical protein